MSESPLWLSIGELPPRGQDDHRYLLINQAAWHEQPEVIRGLLGFERVALFGQPVDACADGATPFLLRLDGHIGNTAVTRPLRTLCSSGCFASAISVLDASQPIGQLAAALSLRCEARLTEGQDVMLRCFDTRVLASLLDVLTPEQHSHLVSCTSHWWFAGRNGVLEPVTVSPWPARDEFTAPWHLTTDQEEALIDASDTDAMVDLLMRRKLEPLLDLPFVERHPVVDGLLARCKQWGLRGTSDQATYCTLALMRRQPDIGQLAPWDQLLPRVQRGELTFAAALAIAAEAD